jgi:hypothetical protein
MKNLLKIIILAGLIFSVGCKDSTEQKTSEEVVEETVVVEPAISGEQTKAVLEHHLKAFQDNNLAEVMADYTAESILVTPDSTYTGLASIESLFVGLFPAFPTEGTIIEMDNMFIQDELAYILWHADTRALDIPMGTDTFIIVDGKIVKQTFAGILNPKE